MEGALICSFHFTYYCQSTKSHKRSTSNGFLAIFVWITQYI